MSCIQVTGLLVVFTASSKLVKSIPNHGSKKFLGHLYWANRYPTLGYTEWDGFWNNEDVCREKYKRARSQISEQVCQGCDCDTVTEELKCDGSSSTVVIL